MQGQVGAHHEHTKLAGLSKPQITSMQRLLFKDLGAANVQPEEKNENSFDNLL